MITKCECLNCGQPIEFEAGQFEKVSENPYRIIGQDIICPNCQQTTQLYIRKQAATKPQHRTSIYTIIIGLLIIIPVGIYVAVAFYQTPGNAGEFGSALLDGIAGFFGLLLYFAPSIFGIRKKNSFAIFMLNLLLGWTLLGWAAAMVWACTKD